MSEKRKDNRGRILRTGESQRKDGLYQYRYADILGTRHYIYDVDLNKLREKEKEIKKKLDQGLDYVSGKMTVYELFERYVATKRVARENSKKTYAYFSRLLQKDIFGKMEIAKVKTLDTKKWLIKLNDAGLGYSTLKTLKAVVGGAFKMALEDDMILKNPWNFSLASVISNDAEKKEILSLEQQRDLLDFIENDIFGCKYYDAVVVLLGTGIRIGEFSGLTVDDVDFERGLIRIDHQLQYYSKTGYKIEKVKSESGNRMIPMSPAVYESLQHALANKGYADDEFKDYIFLNRNGRPISERILAAALRTIRKRYNDIHEDAPLPNITPHSFRHMFCSNMVNANMNIKALQYIMGHSNISITLDVYSHPDYKIVAQEMLEITNVIC